MLTHPASNTAHSTYKDHDWFIVEMTLLSRMLLRNSLITVCYISQNMKFSQEIQPGLTCLMHANSAVIEASL